MSSCLAICFQLLGYISTIAALYRTDLSELSWACSSLLRTHCESAALKRKVMFFSLFNLLNLMKWLGQQRKSARVKEHGTRLLMAIIEEPHLSEFMEMSSCRLLCAVYAVSWSCWPAICDQFTFFACLLCFFCCGLTYTRNIQTQESFSSIYFKSDTLSPKDEKRQQSKFRIFVISGKMITSNKLNRHRLTVRRCRWRTSSSSFIVSRGPTIDKLFIYPQLVTEPTTSQEQNASLIVPMMCRLGVVSLIKIKQLRVALTMKKILFSLAERIHTILSAILLYYYFVFFFVWFSPSLTQSSRV